MSCSKVSICVGDGTYLVVAADLDLQVKLDDGVVHSLLGFAAAGVVLRDALLLLAALPFDGAVARLGWLLVLLRVGSFFA